MAFVLINGSFDEVLVLELSAIILAIGATCAVLLMAVMSIWHQRQQALAARGPEPMALLFDDGHLHHGSYSALQFFGLSPTHSTWAHLYQSVQPRFPSMPKHPHLDGSETATLTADDGDYPQQIKLRQRGPLFWVTFSGTDTPTPARPCVDDMLALQRTARANQNPIWHVDPDGKIIWQNNAHKTLSLHHSDPLFSFNAEKPIHREQLEKPIDKSIQHFEVRQTKVDNITVCQATCIDQLVLAEQAKRHFVQTLSKTFAHLPIGLAIFDRDGQLALFNPALVDLSGVSAPFLSRRPKIMCFFDQMREKRRMPEPKSYTAWRNKISALEETAYAGTYQETWTLEDGRTYTIQGHPYPDGATAFMIKDISAEISLTLNFRKEVELGHALLDQVDDAIAVFSNAGVLTFCNAQYRKLWDHDPESAFVDVTVYDCIGIWRAGCERLNDREEIEQFILSYNDQEPKSFAMILSDGRAMICELRAVVAGSKMVRFRAVRTVPQIPGLANRRVAS